MIIGVPREIKDGEFRASLTPEGVRVLTRAGHRVLVESGAGEESGFFDTDYKKEGGEVLSSAEEIFRVAELIVKVKEPQPREYRILQKGQGLFTFLHLAANRELTNVLLEKEVVGIACETVELPDGSRPLLAPMSEIAGRMSVIIGSYYLQKEKGGEGIVLSGASGVEGGNVVILGSGTVGRNAAKMALGIGARVTVLDQDTRRLKAVTEIFQEKVVTLTATPAHVEDTLVSADLTIGAVLVPGAKAPRLVSREVVSHMKKGSVIVDVSVDQGGCFETSRPTTHSDPIYIEEGVIHYCVTNIPGAVPRTATLALTHASLPFIEKIAALGCEAAIRTDSALAKGVNTLGGRVVHPAVARALGMQSLGA